MWPAGRTLCTTDLGYWCHDIWFTDKYLLSTICRPTWTKGRSQQKFLRLYFRGFPFNFGVGLFLRILGYFSMKGLILGVWTQNPLGYIHSCVNHNYFVVEQLQQEFLNDVPQDTCSGMLFRRRWSNAPRMVDTVIFTSRGRPKSKSRYFWPVLAPFPVTLWHTSRDPFKVRHASRTPRFLVIHAYIHVHMSLQGFVLVRGGFLRGVLSGVFCLEGFVRPPPVIIHLL